MYISVLSSGLNGHLWVKATCEMSQALLLKQSVIQAKCKDRFSSPVWRYKKYAYLYNTTTVTTSVPGGSVVEKQLHVPSAIWEDLCHLHTTWLQVAWKFIFPCFLLCQSKAVGCALLEDVCQWILLSCQWPNFFLAYRTDKWGHIQQVTSGWISILNIDSSLSLSCAPIDLCWKPQVRFWRGFRDFWTLLRISLSCYVGARHLDFLTANRTFVSAPSSTRTLPIICCLDSQHAAYSLMSWWAGRPC